MSSKHVCVFLSVGLIALARAAGQVTFIPLGDLPGGAVNSVANGVSANGTYVVGAGTAAAGGRAFVWTLSGGLVQLGTLTGAAAPTSAAHAVSNSGLVVGESNNADGSQAVKWAPGSTTAANLSVQLDNAVALGVSSDGNTIVGVGESLQPSSFYEGFKKVGESADFVLDDIEGGDIFATPNAVSADGNVAVGSGSSSSDSGQIGIYWQGANPTAASLPDIQIANDTDTYGFANGVNHDGSIIVGQGSPGISFFALNREATRWTRGGDGQYTVTRLGGKVAAAYGTTDDGNTIVGRGRLGSTGTVEAFIWRNSAATKFQLLKNVLITEYGVTNLTGWTLKQANAISADGNVIVGYGTNPSGQTEAWVVMFASPCKADFNGDDFLDFSDFDDFVVAFESGSASADFNGDGFLDFSDFDDFVVSFEAGCGG